ncbi:Fanconi anaemia protein FANCD2 [Endogone sp. FLAS-F59071]|nr:Fanconi anaemia protein FANCD2 [Endogone sp. FLAS-F59071]|eukprot:RUS21065.1 Fanconi anaemia protein FANCD2 [Endogone sp. FLAS-F59071]
MNDIFYLNSFGKRVDKQLSVLLIGKTGSYQWGVLEFYITQTDVAENSEDEVILQCLELLLQALDKLLSWPDLKSPDNQEILKQLLDKIAARMRFDAPSQKHSLQLLAKEVFFYLNKFAEKAPSARIAILLHRLLSKIINITPDPEELSLRSGILAQKFLETEWTDMKNIKVSGVRKLLTSLHLTSDNIIYLLGQKISRSSSSLEVISSYISTVLPAIEQRDDEILKKHPLLNKDTYVVYYKVLSIELVSILDQFQEKDYDHDAAIAHIAEIVTCWQNLTTSIKGNDKRLLLSVVLKYGRAFVNRFTKSTMPFLGGHFKTHRNAVIAILRNFQYATRTLQTLTLSKLWMNTT